MGPCSKGVQSSHVGGGPLYRTPSSRILGTKKAPEAGSTRLQEASIATSAVPHLSSDRLLRVRFETPRPEVGARLFGATVMKSCQQHCHKSPTR